MQQTTLSVVIREALAEQGISTLRAAAEVTGITKDTIRRRYLYEGWTQPELESVARFLGVPCSELYRRAEEVAA